MRFRKIKKTALNTKRIKYLLLGSCCVLFQSLSAQDSSRVGGELEVIRDYNPFIKEAEKLSVPLIIDRIGVQEIKFDYEIEPQVFKVEPTYREPIKPIVLEKVNKEPLGNGYARAYIGNYRNLMGDLYYSAPRNKKRTYSVGLHHNSGKAAPDFSNFGRSSLDLKGEKQYKKHSLGAEIGADYRRVHHYGQFTDSLPDSPAFNPDTLRTNYADFTLGLTYGNLKAKNKKHYFQSYLNGYYHMNNLENSEWAAIGGVDMTEKFSEKSEALFHVSYDYNAFYPDSGSLLRNIVKAEAAYKYTERKWWVKAGFKTASDNYTPPEENASTVNNLHFYPDIHGQVQLVNRYLIAYGGLSGDLRKNSYRSINRFNPWVDNELELRNTNIATDLYFGLKGSPLIDALNLNFGLRYQAVGNYLLFLNIDSAQNYFQPYYTPNNSSIFRIFTEVQYKQHERWMVNLKGGYNSYSFPGGRAWNLPSLEMALDARYNFQDKIIGTFQLYAFDKRYGATTSFEEITEIPGAVDINLGLEYQFNRKLNAHLQINNILNQRYQLFNQYSLQGFHLLLGARYRFL